MFQNKQENTAPNNQLNKQMDRQNAHPLSQNKVLINKNNIKATADNKQMLADKVRSIDIFLFRITVDILDALSPSSNLMVNWTKNHLLCV